MSSLSAPKTSSVSAQEEIDVYKQNINFGFWHPDDDTANKIRDFRISLQIIPPPPKKIVLFWLYIILPIMIITGIIMYILSRYYTYIKGNERNPIILLIFHIVTISLLIFMVWYFFILGNTDIFIDNFQNPESFAEKVGKKEGFQVYKPSDMLGSDTIFVNIQPLSIKQAAYIGPSVNGGKFNPEIGILSALNAGVRMFTLQIDYLDVKKDGFEGPAIPTIVYRDNSGKLISSNGVSINEVATHLSKAFSSEINHSEKPLIVYLHFLKLPYTRYDKPEKYIESLSSIAQALEPLMGNSLSFSPDNFSRQAREKLILRTSVNQLRGRVVLMSNIDTSLFRQMEKIGMSPVEQKYDLDFLTNIRVYKYKEADKLGLTESPPENKIPAAIILPFDHILSMSPSERDVFANENKHRFVIAMPSQEISNPSVDDIQVALTKACVNSIPLNLFGESLESIQRKKAIWNSNMHFLTKPVQYTANPDEAPHIPDTALKTLMAGAQ